MPTTPGGIIYPASGDHTRIWEHFQTLALSVDEALDYEWVALAGFASGWTARAGSHAPAYSLQRGYVLWRGAVTKATAPVNNEILFTLPVAARPTVTINVPCSVGRSSGGPAGRLDIDTGGVVRLAFDTALGGGSWAAFDGVGYSL